MYCVIERAEQVVWGVGETADQAMADAQIEAKAMLFKVDTSVFEIAGLSDSANLNDGGDDLWEFVIFPETAPVPAQQALF